jgi:hypothetical protein
MSRLRISPERAGASLSGLAVLYFGAVVVLTILERSGDIGVSGLQSSADLVADGEVWRLFTSGLVVDGAAVPQIAVAVAAAAVVIRLAGAALWWYAAIAAHVGSALLTYAIIGVAVALGSGGAEAAADDPDFGISCVLGGTLGALFAIGYRRKDTALVAIGLVGLIVLVPFSFDWYGPEHPLSFFIGAAVALRWPARVS